MFKPGKGVRVIYDRDVALWLENTMAEVSEAYDDEDTVLSLTEAWEDWEWFPDQFGDKAVKTIEMESGNQLRVSLIVNKKGEMKLDIREWYVADDE